MQPSDVPQKTPKTKTPERLLTVRDLCVFLDVSESTVRRMVRDGELPVLRVRGLLRFRRGEVLRQLRGDYSTAD